MTDKSKIENTLRAAINSLPLWIAFGDTEGRYFFANDYYTKTFNIPIEKIIGHNFKDVFPPALYDRHKRMSTNASKAAKPSLSRRNPISATAAKLIHPAYIRL